MALRAGLAERTGLLSDFPWPHQFHPLVLFGLVFISLVTIFLGYYHLSLLGVVLSVAAAFLMCYGLSFCAFGLFLAGPWFGILGLTAVCFLVCELLYLLHRKVAHSRRVREMQRSLGLITGSQGA